jgi:hypothetical protein
MGEDFMELLDALRLKIGQQDDEASQLIKEILDVTSTPEFIHECRTLIRMVVSQKLTEEDFLAQFLENITDVSSPELQDALGSFSDQRDELKVLLKKLGENFPDIEPEISFNVTKGLIEDANSEQKRIGHLILKDIALINSLRRIFQINYAGMDFIIALLKKIEEYESLTWAKEIREIEQMQDLALASISEGSFFTEGLLSEASDKGKKKS